MPVQPDPHRGYPERRGPFDRESRMRMREERLAERAQRSGGPGRPGRPGHPPRPDRARRGGGRGRSRKPALSRELIVDKAISMLDALADSGTLNTGELTLRKLAQELDTGPASLYWHARNRGELMTMITEELLARALDNYFEAAELDPRIAAQLGYRARLETGAENVEHIVAIRTQILYLFEQILAHPWLARELVDHGPNSESAVLFWEYVGREFAALPLSPEEQFYFSMSVTNYASGIGAEIATHIVNAQTLARDHLDEVVDVGEQFPFIASVGKYFANHDEVTAFTAGLDLLLAGLELKAAGS